MSVAPGRRGAIAFFVTFGVSLVVLAAALNVGWVVLTWRDVVPLLLGVIVFAAIITGLILNTTFLVREIRRNEQHDAFVNAVTHELKRPVTSIRLHLETLRAREERIDEDPARVLRRDARRQRAAAAGTSTRCCGRNRPRARRSSRRGSICAPLSNRRVALGRAQLGVAADAMRCAPAAAVPDDPVEVIGDEGEISSAIMNLLDNAVKYSGDRVDVDVAVTRDGPRARVSVSDGGVGLSPLEIKRIFHRFYRVPGPLTRRMHGTGLGLFIVQTAARRHGGRAYADERRARPRDDVLSRTAGGASERGLIPMPALLVVEDEPHIASGLRFNLEAEGHRVTVVDSGEAALEAIDVHGVPVDCIILDVMLPAMDGFDVASRAAVARRPHADSHADRARAGGGRPARIRSRCRRLSAEAIRPGDSRRPRQLIAAAPGLARRGPGLRATWREAPA